MIIYSNIFSFLSPNILKITFLDWLFEFLKYFQVTRSNIVLQKFQIKSLNYTFQQIGVQILALLLTSHVTLGKLLNLFVPQLHHLSIGNDSTSLDCYEGY